MSGYAGTVDATYGSGDAVSVGASFRQILDVAQWDRSLAINAPGQNGSPGLHFADLAPVWKAGGYFPLSFGDRAVQESAETTLTLTPRRHQ
jgi:penicillin amidase